MFTSSRVFFLIVPIAAQYLGAAARSLDVT